MDKFIIKGGKRLKGEIEISGAKNAALALMPATLLANGIYNFTNMPNLRDVKTMASLLNRLGVDIRFRLHRMTLNTKSINKYEAPYELVKKMRASIYVLGPLVARYGYAKVSMPGGCAWGPRPINLHLEGLSKLGVKIELDQGYIIAKANRLTGNNITFDVSSVGATGNILMASVLARGTTIIENAAIEPEITALAEFLLKMGAKISGIGTRRLEIEGVDELTPVDEKMIPDRIEAGTFLIAGAITKGEVTVTKCNPENLTAILEKLKAVGCRLEIGNDSVKLKAPKILKSVDVKTEIYPGFPTDMQAQWIALMTLASGTSVVTDTIYYDRFKHVPELMRLGADIELHENVAVVRGVRKLIGAKVMSTDLRASASLILAGLVAEGTTEVLRVYHIDRGYEFIEKKLRALGADIRRVSSKEY
ncbi:MAG: UDP-N-acetylglucosamine 1-carboxyvinyltransferase [Ignavibacteriae bacterium]|nr:MAG: UDP-N-acetylglucosamine 1-carboxyvinyltransferase [Ignavibacteriota bacterium]